MEQKKEIRFVEDHLTTSYEYSIEELTARCIDIFDGLKEKYKLFCEKEGCEFTRYTIESTAEGGYYGDYSAEFKLITYRTETDKEFTARISHNKKEAERREIQRKAAEAKELTKKLEKEELMKDPEYLKLLELQKKFKGK